MKGMEFNFDKLCLEYFQNLKKTLIFTPIMQTQDRNIPFEIVCDATKYTMGVVLGHK